MEFSASSCNWFRILQSRRAAVRWILRSLGAPQVLCLELTLSLSGQVHLISCHIFYSCGTVPISLSAYTPYPTCYKGKHPRSVLE